jgi:hypothetical protein
VRANQMKSRPSLKKFVQLLGGPVRSAVMAASM